MVKSKYVVYRSKAYDLYYCWVADYHSEQGVVTRHALYGSRTKSGIIEMIKRDSNIDKIPKIERGIDWPND